MTRLAEKRYQLRVSVAMVVYVALMLLVWPLARSATSPPLKVLLALAPMVPMLYVIALMARRVWQSDELQQRTHLIALGASTVIVAVASLVGGFLASARVVDVDGSILVWVFPVMLFSYYAAQWWVARHYGNDLSCDGGDAGMPLRRSLLTLAGLIGLAGWFAYRSHDAFDAGLAMGMGIAAVLVAAVRIAIRWHARKLRSTLQRDQR